MNAIHIPHELIESETLTGRELTPYLHFDTLGTRQTLVPSEPFGWELRVRVPGGRLVLKGEGDLPEWVIATVEKLCDLLWLNTNWDSYGAAPVDRFTVELALDILFAIMQRTSPLPSVVPTSCGGVQLEWHTGGIDLEIEIEPAGSIDVLFCDQQINREWEGSLGSDYSALTDAINSLTERNARVPLG